MRTSHVVKSYLDLLYLGMSDFDTTEDFRRDKSYQKLLFLDVLLHLARVQ